MSNSVIGPEKGHGDSGTVLEQRSVRALTECMTVLPEGGDVYTVVSESGSSYRVDHRQGRCTCPDNQYNLDDDEQCKHQRRVDFATGKRAIPQWVNADAVDGQLGEHVTQTPVVADGGVIADDDPKGQPVEASEDDDARPSDCQCIDFNSDVELPCWPCYREGFETPAVGDQLKN